MRVTNEELSVRVDRVERRLATVERDMATKADIDQILRAINRFEAETKASIAEIKSDTAGPVETFNAARSFGNFFKWVGGIFAAVIAAYVAWRGLK